MLILLAACGKSNLDLPTETMNRSLPDETSTNVTITEFNEGKIGYILKADRIDRYYDRRMLYAYKVELKAFDQKKGSVSVMKADSTIVDDARNVIFANGRVSLTSTEGSVATDRMVWDRNQDTIVAPGRVVLTQHGNVLRGTNLHTNLNIYPTEMDSVSAEGYFAEEYLDW